MSKFYSEMPVEIDNHILKYVGIREILNLFEKGIKLILPKENLKALNELETSLYLGHLLKYCNEEIFLEQFKIVEEEIMKCSISYRIILSSMTEHASLDTFKEYVMKYAKPYVTSLGIFDRKVYSDLMNDCIRVNDLDKFKFVHELCGDIFSSNVNQVKYHCKNDDFKEYVKEKCPFYDAKN